MTKLCPICKKDFLIKSNQKKKIYCSSKCFGISYKNKRINKSCKACNKNFNTVPSDKRNYCSYTCSGINRRKRITKICEFCKNKFETFPCRKGKKYCSKNCSSACKIKNINHKRCSKCARCKNINNFSNDSWCKSCMNLASKKSQTTLYGRYKKAINQARRRDIIFTITQNQYSELVKLPCHYCNAKIAETSVGIDRKENLKGYEIDNCTPCCARCNYVKGWLLTYEEMVYLGKHLEILDKIKINHLG